MATKKAKRLPARHEVDPKDCWDLSSLFSDDASWETAFSKWERRVDGYERFRGKLSDPKELAACFKFDLAVQREGERLGIYAFLKTSEDQSNSTYQGMYARFIGTMSLAAQASAFIRPEILSISATKLDKLCQAAPLKPYRLALKRIIRQKPHTLGRKEERLLAMQTEMSRTPSNAFDQLNDADLEFGMITDDKGERFELSHASFMSLLQSPKRAVRKKAFHQFYAEYDAHKNAMAALLAGSIHNDVYYARARNHPTARQAVLFDEHIPVSVYDTLLQTVRRYLPELHRYYDLRRRKMRLRDIHHYDTYVPILSDIEVRHTWDEAVDVVIDALAPLGDDYCQTLGTGLHGPWCDRYENAGKQSGAFSCGSFDGYPYILMNYQEQVLDSVFTLAHEAGHSMHSYYSAKKQPYQYYDYELFVAEVASTLNEELLSHHLLEHATSDRQRAYLINRRIDAMRGTIFRQTMFAEFEATIHRMAEEGHPLTVDAFRHTYRELLETYFGPDFTIDEALSLECFRIPHFYRAFYVYKYATGMSAAVALAQGVLDGPPDKQRDYLAFLGAGRSKDPLDLLRDAGVDMESPAPIETALDQFADMVTQLDDLL